MFLRFFNRLRLDMLPIPLGRWERTCNSKNNIKIDWANTDHCGTCSYKKQVPLMLPLQNESSLLKPEKSTENKVPNQ